MKKSIALIMAVLVLMTTLLSNAVFAANDPAFVVSNVTGKPGDTVEVTVSATNNPGIVSLKVLVGYDAEVLELVSAVKGADFSDTSFGPTTKNPFNVLWDQSHSYENITTNGVIATLTFRILDTAAAGKSDIVLTYDPNDVYDVNMDNVAFATVAGSVTVEAEEVVDFPTAVNSNGANIRVGTQDTTAGLRFAATLTKEMLGIDGDYVYTEDGDMTFGMILLPTHLLEASDYDTLSEYFMSGNATPILDVVAKKIWAQDDDLITYTAVITDIPSDKWDVQIEAVPYMLKDGEYYFAETDKKVKSYYDVAKAARESDYTDSNIAAITDPTEKATAQKIADNLDIIIESVENPDPDGPGWIGGWY